MQLRDLDQSPGSPHMTARYSNSLPRSKSRQEQTKEYNAYAPHVFHPIPNEVPMINCSVHGPQPIHPMYAPELELIAPATQVNHVRRKKSPTPGNLSTFHPHQEAEDL